MIHIINRHNQHLYASVLRQMHELRHTVFVEEKGWKTLARDDRLEFDQFDTDEAVYFLKLDKDDKILGGMRLVPTVQPTQLGTIFSQWCHFEAPPRSPEIWEWSRYFIVDNKYRSKAGYPVFYELFFAILEYAVKKGIQGLSGFLEAVTLPRLSALPWNIRYLGNIVTYGGANGEPEGKGAAILVEIDRRMLRITKRMKKMTEPYFALPLGDRSPAPHMAYPPEVCFRFLDFLEEHPEHVDTLIAFSSLFYEQRDGTRSSLKDQALGWVEEEQEHYLVEGFDPAAMTANLSHTYSYRAQ